MIAIKTVFTVNNIVSYVDSYGPHVIGEINNALNNPEFEPHGIGANYNLVAVSHELGYWAELNAYLIGLWGALKYHTDRNQKERMAVRDFIYEAAQAARKNWDSASRVQSSYELLAEDTRMSNQRKTF